MREDDIRVEVHSQGSLVPCKVIDSTLEYILCETGMQLPATPLAKATVTPFDSSAAENKIVSVSSGSKWVTGSPAMALQRTDFESYFTDHGVGKGRGWVEYSPSLLVSGWHRVVVHVPFKSGSIARSNSVPVVIFHSTDILYPSTVIYVNMEADAGKEVDVGTFFFTAGSDDTRVVIDNSNTAFNAEVTASTVTFSQTARPETGHGEGCPNMAAANFDPTASAEGDSAHCIFVGGRGIMTQVFEYAAEEEVKNFYFPTQDGTGTGDSASQMASPAPLATCPFPKYISEAWGTPECSGEAYSSCFKLCADNDGCWRKCRQWCSPKYPRVGLLHENAYAPFDAKPAVAINAIASNLGFDPSLPAWGGRAYDGKVTYASKTGNSEVEDCALGRCNTHDTCPSDTFCCFTDEFGVCKPPGTGAGPQETDGWRLVFRQVLPSRAKYEKTGGTFDDGEFRKNPTNDNAALFSILDELESFRGDDGYFDFKMRFDHNRVQDWMNTLLWRQATNPVRSTSTLSSQYTEVLEDTMEWLNIAGLSPDEVDALFARSLGHVFRVVAGKTVLGYYKRVTPLPSTVSLHSLLYANWDVAGNLFGVDYRLYQTEQDLFDDTNYLLSCDHAVDKGFPYQCGMTSSSRSGSLSIAVYAQQYSGLPRGFRGLSRGMGDDFLLVSDVDDTSGARHGFPSIGLLSSSSLTSLFGAHEGEMVDIDTVELFVRPPTNPNPRCVSCKACFDSDGRLLRRNLALKHATALTSTRHPGHSQVNGWLQIIDGDRTCGGWAHSGSTHLDHTCAYTDIEDNPWMQIDLGSNETVSGVSLWVPANAYSPRITEVDIWGFKQSLVGLEGETERFEKHGMRCGTAEIFPSVDNRVECSTMLTGVRFIVVTARERSSLALCEVEVYGLLPSCPAHCVLNSVLKNTTRLGFEGLHQVSIATKGWEQARLLQQHGSLPQETAYRLGATRSFGFFHAPVTANYTFHATFDDEGELFLGSSADPRSKHRLLAAAMPRALFRETGAGTMLDSPMQYFLHFEIAADEGLVDLLFVQFYGTGKRAPPLNVRHSSSGQVLLVRGHAHQSPTSLAAITGTHEFLNSFAHDFGGLRSLRFSRQPEKHNHKASLNTRVCFKGVVKVLHNGMLHEFGPSEGSCLVGDELELDIRRITPATLGFDVNGDFEIAEVAPVSSAPVPMRRGESRWIEILHVNQRGRDLTSVSLTVDQGGNSTWTTSDLFDLSAEWLRMPSAEANTVHVAVNGLEAACTAAVTNGTLCAFNYSTAHTPKVLAISPSQGPAGTRVQIEGSGFSETLEMNTIKIGLEDCTIRSANSDTIICELSDGATSGTWDVQVTVEPNGFSVGNGITFTVTGGITSVLPRTLSLEGGTNVLIKGEGFASFGPYNQGTFLLYAIRGFASALFCRCCYAMLTWVLFGTVVCTHVCMYTFIHVCVHACALLASSALRLPVPCYIFPASTVVYTFTHLLILCMTLLSSSGGRRALHSRGEKEFGV
jgi:hypothetical protein